MTFSPEDAKQFQAMTNQPGSNVQVSLHAQAGQDLSYAISGTGTVPDEQANGHVDGDAQGSGGAMGGATAEANRPGGGLGKPIDAPDGLAKYRWYILGALLTLLVGGGIWTHERSQAGGREPRRWPPFRCNRRRNTKRQLCRPRIRLAPANLLLAALKEELFELEVERQQGKLTPDEYEKARAALEQTLKRALARDRG